ncbi:MAG: transketolase [Oscillospiraceae bacterium]|nr:transketolase [Oscillospiraceae bacterium]
MNCSISELKQQANSIRRDIIEIAYKAQGPSHPGPALSCTDIVTALYFRVLRNDPSNPAWEDRDRFVLSKGHACPVLYSALAERGYFPMDWLPTVRRVDSHLQGHPDMKKTPGVDMTSGSLGNGLSLALGMAIYLKHAGKSSQVYCILGDGEIQEGTVWEAVLAAPAMKMDNLVAIVDCNHLQSCGAVPDIQDVPGMSRAWEALGWNVVTINGHNMEEVVSTLEMARDFRGKPTCIMANTVKGKGVSFMEFDNAWHQKLLTEEQYNQAVKELEEERACL